MKRLCKNQLIGTDRHKTTSQQLSSLTDYQQLGMLIRSSCLSMECLPKLVITSNYLNLIQMEPTLIFVKSKNQAKIIKLSPE